MREAIRTSVEKAQAGEEGSLTLEVTSGGLWVAQAAIAHSVNMIVSGHHDG